MGNEYHVANSLGVPVSSDFLTPFFTGLEVWGVKSDLWLSGHSECFPLGDCVPGFRGGWLSMAHFWLPLWECLPGVG